MFQGRGGGQEVIRSTLARYKRIDVSYNNAGVLFLDGDSLVHELSLEGGGLHHGRQSARAL
jgi:hypothetical protein